MTDKQMQEPVAWMHWLNGPCQLYMNKDEAMLELERLNRQYPVDSHARKMRPLVFGDTAPPAAQPAVPLTEKDIASACLSYRHDFGLMDETNRGLLMFQAREWARAFGLIVTTAAPEKGQP
jgi:hypothetical protein